MGRTGSAAVLFCCLLLLPACFSKNGDPNPAKTVSLGIWSNFVTPEVLKDFETRTGIHVLVSNYSSNEELLAKLQTGASGYDVVVPTDYMVGVMIKLGLLRKLDLGKIPNSKGIDPRYLKRKFDPESAYSVPYDVGTTGIAVNRSLYRGELKGWKGLFGNPDLAGKFTLLDDVREVLGAALKMQGFSLNSKKADELAKAKSLLLKAKGKVKAFTSEPLTALVNGETAVAHAYACDALQARKATSGKIEYILPEEGGTFYIDVFSIPSTAAHLEEAHSLINYLIEAKVLLGTATRLFLTAANREVLPLLPPGFAQENPALYPSEATLSRFEMIEDLGESLRDWDRIWTEIKAEK